MQEIRAGERLLATSASTRLRVLMPAAELARRLPVMLIALDRFIRDPTREDLGTPRALVVSKPAAGAVIDMERELRVLLEVIAAGRCPARVFADLSDDHAALAEPFRAPFLAESISSGWPSIAR